jgi:hypothetical protein
LAKSNLETAPGPGVPAQGQKQLVDAKVFPVGPDQLVLIDWPDAFGPGVSNPKPNKGKTLVVFNGDIDRDDFVGEAFPKEEAALIAKAAQGDSVPVPGDREHRTHQASQSDQAGKVKQVAN